jgi:hypothetical protein
MAAFFIEPPHKPQMSLHRILSGSAIFWYTNQDASNKRRINKFKYKMYSTAVDSQRLLAKSIYMATFCK